MDHAGLTAPETGPAMDQLVVLLDEAKKTMDSRRRPDDALSCAVAYLIDTALNAAAIPAGGSVEDALTVLGLARGAVIAATMLVRQLHDASRSPSGTSSPAARNARQ
jgi:hypothetical protein